MAGTVGRPAGRQAGSLVPWWLVKVMKFTSTAIRLLHATEIRVVYATAVTRGMAK
jgi:hypothetical protein